MLYAVLPGQGTVEVQKSCWSDADSIPTANSSWCPACVAKPTSKTAAAVRTRQESHSTGAFDAAQGRLWRQGNPASFRRGGV